MNLAPRLKALRKEAGFTKAHVSRECGVTDVSVNYWESGRIKEIGHAKLLTLAALYKLSVSELLDDPNSVPHWTDAHIRHEGAEWVAYDEASLEHSRHTDKNAARDSLVVYAATTLKTTIPE